MKQVSQEDLELDRRVTRTEADIGNNSDKIDSVDRNTKSLQSWFFTGILTIITLFFGLLYFIHNDNQRQSADIRQQFDKVNEQFVEVRAEVVENRQLIELSFGRLDLLQQLQLELNETNKPIDVTPRTPLKREKTVFGQ